MDIRESEKGSRKTAMNRRTQEQEPLRCVNPVKADIRFQDGGLPYVLGAKNYQVLRADRKTPGVGSWTYNHAPMLVYWENRFFIEYLSGPEGEHIPPSRTLLSDSADGREWSLPREVFPPLRVDAAPYCGPGRESIAGDKIDCIMHQRMGFFVSRENRLLVLGFYGISPTPEIAPNNGFGIGRVVREVYRDGSFSPVYFLRKNVFGGYTREKNVFFPDYNQSEDAGFRSACGELLSDRVIRQQWWEEEWLDKAFFGIAGSKAISCYTLPDGRIMGVCKNSMVTETDAEGSCWEPLVKCPSLETSTGKVWGQRTGDGKYALVYNPTTDSAHRWPLALVTGEDGRKFDGLSALTPEISPCRYAGILKNLGAQYVRGIWESYPQPEDGSMWLTYSVNKEDIWAAQVPVPVRNRWIGGVDETPDEESIRWWNINSLKWAPVTLEKQGEEGGFCLRIEDTEPCDRPRALRIFERAEKIRFSVSLMVREAPLKAGLLVELQDEGGRVPVRIHFRGDGYSYVRTGGRESRAGAYELGKWLNLELLADCRENSFTVHLEQEGREFRRDYTFSQSVHSLERVLFTTKASLPWNTLEDSGRDGSLGDLMGSEERLSPTVCCIGRLRVTNWEQLPLGKETQAGKAGV